MRPQDNSVFKTAEGKAKLRRVLVVFSWRNRVVGYAQSMNFIVALLLLFMEEEAAFWTLTVIVGCPPRRPAPPDLRRGPRSNSGLRA